MTHLEIPLAKDNSLGLESNLAPNEINKFERKVSGKEGVRVEKWFTLFILNKFLFK